MLYAPASHVTRALLFLAFVIGSFAAGYTAVRVQERTAGDRDEGREEWQKVPEIFDALGAAPGRTIADIGAGGGFFTLRLADVVGPSGRVLAVDIDGEAVERLRLRAERDGLAQVQVVLGTPDDPRLPPGELDAALIVNAYHEMHEGRAVLGHIREALKIDGRLVIVEPLSHARAGAPRDVQVQHHEIGIEYVIADLTEAGFQILERQDVFVERPDTRRADIDWLLVAVKPAPEPEPPVVEEAPTPPRAAPATPRRSRRSRR